MREIKFRVWDFHKKEMIYEGVDYYASFSFDGTVNTVAIYNANELMQYTGLKDKNGVEIYEGDIVLFKSGSVYEVDFDDGAFGVDGVFINAREINDRGMEVIGNIYEHSHLLEVSK